MGHHKEEESSQAKSFNILLYDPLIFSAIFLNVQ